MSGTDRAFSGYSGGVSAGGAAAASGWTRDVGPPAVVRLTTITDQVGVGTVAPLSGSKMDVVQDDATNNAITDVLVVDHTTSGVPAAGIGAGLLLRAEGTGGLQNAARIAAVLTNVGAGTEAGVITLSTRTGGGALAERWRVDGSGNLVMQGDFDLTPATDDDGEVGTSALRFTMMSARAFRVYGAAGDANPLVDLANDGIRFGPGGATAVNAKVVWRAANALTTSGLVPETNGLDLGEDASRWDLFSREVWVQARNIVVGDSPYALVTGDYQLNCDTSGGAIIVNLPATATNLKRVFRICKTTTDANTVTVTPPGGSTIAGGAANIVLAGGAVRSADVTGPVSGLDWVVS